jgi:hypothetical protein
MKTELCQYCEHPQAYGLKPAQKLTITEHYRMGMHRTVKTVDITVHREISPLPSFPDRYIHCQGNQQSIVEYPTAVIL